MSLTDLKKTSSGKGKKKDFTVDEFISDSEKYAKGSPEIVSGDREKQQDLADAIAGAKALVEQKAKQAQVKDNEQKQANTRYPKITAVKAKKSKESVVGHKKFRHATFTLSEEVITQLQYLADETHLAKSHIIRILINELDDEEKVARLKQALSLKID